MTFKPGASVLIAGEVLRMRGDMVEIQLKNGTLLRMDQKHVQHQQPPQPEAKALKAAPEHKAVVRAPENKGGGNHGRSK